MEGPILLAKLSPGTYTVRATSGGQTQTKTVTIAPQGLRQLDFRWPRAARTADDHTISRPPLTDSVWPVR